MKTKKHFFSMTTAGPLKLPKIIFSPIHLRLGRGTAKEKEAILSVMTRWYSQNDGCARHKRSTRVSFACSSRAATKHTANAIPTRASYFSGATADAELSFRMTAKSAFHGRPLNGD